MFNQEEINLLVKIAKKSDKKASEQLWDFYFPIILETVDKYFDIYKVDISFKQDLIQDCYCLLVDVIKDFDQDSYCFSFYVKQFMDENIPKLIVEKYIN